MASRWGRGFRRLTLATSVVLGLGVALVVWIDQPACLPGSAEAIRLRCSEDAIQRAIREGGDLTPALVAIVVAAGAPWAVFYALRWIMRGFASDERGRA